ncbi:MAG: endolysin [Cyanobium sp.]|uniref:glycoside hydrolase family 24 protein n=2 Tax=unclassified Synechococcus TaxID=2626047 RepID=UPI000DB57915|nr:glycoside hydrolase family 104 protein [Synechococcus sp. CS-1326]MCT0213235.1 glycoside hydrolase family 104 protein [Synechococcus sp. CS-1326]MCT0231952.1 glycoside hydrolase family 104 protein [Synechococcus sp. CS-1327]PZV00876.1 MAG: endolysin [Cyanobium sp.]
MRTFFSHSLKLLLPAVLFGLMGPAQASVWDTIRRNTTPNDSLEPNSVAVVAPEEAVDQPRSFAITPERRALLNTIRFAEGTWANGHDQGYWILFGGSLMASLDRHPNRVMRTTGYASAAAGAYQFMPPTWAIASNRLGLQGFGPDVQDQAAIFLIRHRGALHLADRGEMTPELAARLAPEWASFPTLAGRSFYGQPVKRFAELKRFYEANLASLRAGLNSRRAEIASAPKPRSESCEPGSLACALQEASLATP